MLTHEVNPTPERDARLDAALVALCDGKFVSGDDVAIVMGHVTMRCMLDRCLFSIYRPTYDFIHALVPGMRSCGPQLVVSPVGPFVYSTFGPTIMQARI